MEVLRKEGVRRDKGLTGRHGQEQSPRGLLPGGRSPRLPERVGPGLGVGPPRGAVPAPGPKGSALSPTQTHTIRPGRETIRFPACCALPCAVCLCVCVRVWRLVGRMPRAARGSPWAWPWAGACTRPRNKLKVPVETGGSGVHRTGPGGASSVHTPLLTAWCWHSGVAAGGFLWVD